MANGGGKPSEKKPEIPPKDKKTGEASK